MEKAEDTGYLSRLSNKARELFDDGFNFAKKTALSGAVAGMLLQGCAALTPAEITSRYGEPIPGRPGEYVVRRPSKKLPVGFVTWYVVSWADGGRSYYWFGKHPWVEGAVNAGVIVGLEEAARAEYQDRHPRTGRGPLPPVGPKRRGGDVVDSTTTPVGPTRGGGGDVD